MFVYQRTISTLQLQKDKSVYYVISSESKGYIVLLFLQNILIYLRSIKSFDSKIETESCRSTNYSIKIVNAFIVNELNTWPKNMLGNFTLKRFLFSATNILKNSDKDKWVHSAYRIAFDGKGSWSLGYDVARKVVRFGVDNSSSSHSNDHNKNFSVLGKCSTSDINGSFGFLEK